MINPLLTILKADIRANGPMTLARYMEFCLLHPKYGYYTTAESIGGHGDFITAPEISQCFGEMLGIWVLDLVHQMPEDQVLTLVELGPGRGALMADLSRTLLKFVPKDRLSILMVEASDKLKENQKKALQACPYTVSWAANLDNLPPQMCIFVANEFFDALPVHQWQKTPEGWAERMVGLDEQDKLSFGLGPPVPMAKGLFPKALEDGAIVELSPISQLHISAMAKHIETYGGGGVVIDYRYHDALGGDTFQAMSKHGYADPLENPGRADLTAHVNFSALDHAVRKSSVAVYPILTQGDFLQACGIHERMVQLTQQDPKKSGDVISGVERLVAPDQMGKLFKVLQVTSKNLLPGLFQPHSEAPKEQASS